MGVQYRFRFKWIVVIYVLLLLVVTVSSQTCHKRLESCEMGHEMRYCETEDNEPGRYCKQCGEFSFQPNENTFGDRCRLRKSCLKYRMFYRDAGSRIKDAECQCNEGFHFETEAQRACVPN